MPIMDFEREGIRKSAEFLESYGYTKMESQYSIDYCLNNVCISIIYPPNSEESDVNICYIDKNKVFSVGWIALARDGIRGCNEKLINVKNLLKYIKKNYLKLIDYQFCLDSEKLIDKYVENNQSKFENAILNFLKSQKE